MKTSLFFCFILTFSLISYGDCSQLLLGSENGFVTSITNRVTKDPTFRAELKLAFSKIEEMDETPGIAHVSRRSTLPQNVQAIIEGLVEGDAYEWQFQGHRLIIVDTYEPVYQALIFDESGELIASEKFIDNKYVWIEESI